MDMRSTPFQRHKLSPFEIVMGRPMRAMTTITPVPDLNLTHSALLQYCKGLMQAVSHFHSQVRVAWPMEPTSNACHNLKPGDWVYVRRHHRKHTLEPQWKGPHQELLTTQTAVKLSGIAEWIHASQCKKAPSPENQSSPQNNAESILTPEEDVEEQSAIPYNLCSCKGCQKQTTNNNKKKAVASLAPTAWWA
ncbi:unnamed protein product [Caretta caretta]